MDKHLVNCNIKRAENEDIEDLINLRVSLLKEVGNIKPQDVVSLLKEKLKEYFKSSIVSGEFKAWLALIDDKVVATSGFIDYNVPPHMSNFAGREVYIMNMYTLPDYRGRGIGMKLMEAITNFAEDKEIDVIWLRAEEKAESLYKRAGFRKTDKYMEYRT